MSGSRGSVWPVATMGGQQPPEGAPSPLCPAQAVLKRGLKPSCTIIPLMKKDHADNLQFFLSNVGQLHLAGWVRAPARPPR